MKIVHSIALDPERLAKKSSHIKKKEKTNKPKHITIWKKKRQPNASSS